MYNNSFVHDNYVNWFNGGFSAAFCDLFGRDSNGIWALETGHCTCFRVDKFEFKLRVRRPFSRVSTIGFPVEYDYTGGF